MDVRPAGKKCIYLTIWQKIACNRGCKWGKPLQMGKADANGESRCKSLNALCADPLRHEIQLWVFDAEAVGAVTAQRFTEKAAAVGISD